MSMTALLLAGAAGLLCLGAPWALGTPAREDVGRARRRRAAFAWTTPRRWTGRAARLRDELPAPLRPLFQVLVLDARGPEGSGLHERLIHAGKDPLTGWRWVRLGQLALGALFAAIGLAIALLGGLPVESSVLAGAMAGSVGASVPLLELSWQARRRREGFRRELVPFLHMLAALVGAGLSLQDGLRQVAQSKTALAAELEHAFALRDAVGVDLDEALRQMAGRCATDEVTTALRRIVIARRKSGAAGPIAVGLLQLAEATRVTLRSERRVRKGRMMLTNTILVVLLGLPPLLCTLTYPMIVFFLQSSH